MRDTELWSRLEAFRFDAETGSEPFSVKLAAHEGWSTDHTQRVIEEYRKFLYLTQVSDGQVTPSVPVDRAWHMHLTFTRSYWDQLCKDVLNAPLHHEPCAGQEDMPRYNSQYDETLILYQSEFGSVPPSDIWPIGVAAPRDSTWLYSIGLGIGGPGTLVAIIIMISVGVTFWTVLALFVFGGLLIAGLAAIPEEKKSRDSGYTGGGFGGCGDGGGKAKSGKSNADGGGDGGAGGCGGGGCGGGG